MKLRPASLLLCAAAPLAAAACGANAPSASSPSTPAPAPASEATEARLPVGGEATAPPPVAKKEARTMEIHGQKRVDEYAWLQNKGSAEVLDYLRAENEYTNRVMHPTEALQKALYSEMLGRIEENDETVPYRRGRYLYSSRTEAGKAYNIFVRRRATGDAPEEVLLDLNEIARSEKFVSVATRVVSDDDGTLAYLLDTVGFRQYVLRFKDLKTGRDLPERIERVTSMAFAKDGKSVLYTVEDDVSKRSYRVHRHVLGTDPKSDPLLFEEKDERFNVELDASRSRDFIVVTSQSPTTTEVRTLRRDASTALVLFAPREAGHRYFVEHAAGRFLVRTDGAGKNFRLCTASVGNTSKSAWREVVPHRKEVMLEDVIPFAKHVVLVEREDGLPRFTVTDASFAHGKRIAFPQAAYSAAPMDNVEYDAPSFRFSYESPVDAPSVFDYDLGAGTKTLKKQLPVKNYDASRYATERVHAVAKDGTKIPISIVYRKDLRTVATPQPTVLYGYGSYGISIDAYFSSARASLLDRGVVFALAHIRGGGELGKQWHDEGRMLSKMNTFTDFIAAAEYLQKTGVTAPDRLAIEGGSAGGLLMGAVTNMRPDLFKVVVSHVPFVDVLNTMLDESLPLTVGEFEEWGNPKVREQYDYMAKYSPYDNLAPKAYPTMLVKTSYHDSQVMYWEPAKYVARLRALKTNDTPLLFKTELEAAGHGGPSGRYNHLREVAFDDAFLIRYLGVHEAAAPYTP